ncbi:phage portal protein, partial [Phytohabitans flavus]|uniref:phage portal protein n=1 Tax=Phytohabitans flavus TaxID=1076124 RepID=UPI003643811A
KSVQDFSLSEMNKKDSYVIKYDRSISPEKRQAMIQDFVRMIKDNGGAVVQEKGFEYDRFATNFQPSDLSTVESITRARIATAFNVPISFLSESEASHSNKTAEQVMTQFVEMTCCRSSNSMKLNLIVSSLRQSNGLGLLF